MTLFRPSDLLILDEPEQRLDTQKRDLIGSLLRDRQRAGTTLIVASHDPRLTEAIAGEVLDLGWGPSELADEADDTADE